MGQQRMLGRVIGTVALAAAIAVSGLGAAVAAPAPAPRAEQRAEALRSEHGAPAAHHRTGSRQALRVGDGKGDGGDYYLVTDAGCAKGKGKAKPNAVVYSAKKLRLDWTVTGPANQRKTGTVTVKKDRGTRVPLPKVGQGSYHLVLTAHGSSTPVADETFDVLPCVVVTTSCHAITFTNPTGNPDAWLGYEGHKKSQWFDLDLPAGQTRTVRADYAKVDYRSVGRLSDDPEEGKPMLSDLGHGTVSVKQHCSVPPAQPGSEAVQSTGDVGCSEAGAPAVVGVAWAVQPSVKKTRYEVVDAAQQVVKAGTFSGGRHKTLRLPAGAYHYRSYGNRSTTPFEDVAFSVLSCVQVTPVCRALEVHNPNPVALDVFVFGYDEDDESDEGASVDTTATPSGTTTIPWSRPGAYVLVLPTGDEPASRFAAESLTPDLGYGDVEVEVPQDC